MGKHYTCDRCGKPIPDGKRGGLELPRRKGETVPASYTYMPGLGGDGETTVLVPPRSTRWYDLCPDCRASLTEWVSRND